jgi:S-DNA-T family DNA segregation ATPase FtsK/SpoIIIE
MATTQTEARAKAPAPKNTRRNEIIAILLCATGVLLALCLVSYRPDDPSWNAAGQNATRNWIGPFGANIAATLFQFVGLAAYLLPLLLLAAAWRRFRTRRIRAPLSRIIGLATLVLAAAALFNIFIARPLFDGSFLPGGLAGALISRGLVGALSTAGASILLSALAATGLLLATNFSFIRASEWLGQAFGNRFSFFRNLPERFRAWQTARRERAQLRMNMRRAAREEREAARAADRLSGEKTAAERVAEFMNEGEGVSAAAAIKRAAIVSETAVQPKITPPEGAKTVAVSASAAPLNAATSAAAATAAVAGQGVVVVEQPAPTKHSIPKPGRSAHDAEADEAAQIEAMVKTAEVVRTEIDEEKYAPPTTKQSRRTSAVAISNYKMPELGFLNSPPPHLEFADDEYYAIATRLAEKCKEFNVTGKIEHICPGPVVTTYEFKPDPGVKYSRVTGLVDDLCLALKAESIRIDRLPGKAHVGIEVPSPHRETIHLREVIESRQFSESPSKLTIALGKTIDGLNYVADLAKMPHLLIAGTTGAGKSVGVNALIVSILYKATPDEVKFILIDPKRLELGLYEDIPHLATPIITDPKRATHALKWAVGQMEKRYKDLAGWGVRNIDGYNAEVLRRNLVKDYDEVTNEPWKPLPYIVIIIDELADLMMVSGHEVEESITRLAQMARAVGIHLVLATQRPSVDVITGLIKANFPSRISFRVSSKVDSRTIIDANGAEQLLGRGDMLFLPPGTSRLIRVHGAFVDEAEIGRIVSHIKAQSEPLYDETITQSEEEAMGLDAAGGERDELFEDALRICVEMKRASTSVLQRRLRIGYGRAAAILDMMEREGFIGQADGARPRPILSRAYETVAEWDEEPE